MAVLARRRAPRWVLAFSFLACVALISSCASALQFRVGGPRGWHKPTGKETETYNEWARRNRFHIGDSVYFKYENDSVLVVDYGDYSHCNLTSPLQEFEGGNTTTFKFNRYGFFYFISGQPGHCSAGQKLVIRVMVHPPRATSPASAPALSVGGGSGPAWGPGPSSSPTASSSFKLGIDLSVLVMAALAVVLATALPV